MSGCTGAVFIALTGNGQEQDRPMAMQADFHHHMVKPADTQKLVKNLAALERPDPGAAHP
jgi:CheY-like chemotaxis protein